jgi:hypothetical protein
VLKQHKHQAENRNRSKKTELEILTAAKEVVEVPVILSPRTGRGQQCHEHNEDATNHGTAFKGPVRERSLRTRCLLQSILSIFLDSTRSHRRH